MRYVYTCLREAHDQTLLLLAALVCLVGVYASLAVARHAARTDDRSRRYWAATAIMAAGCTAWSTHMIGLLAFRPGMLSGFDPLLTVLSLVLAVVGIGISIGSIIGRRNRRRRMVAGVFLGLSIALLHYFGQYAYKVTGHISWDYSLVAQSLIFSLPLFGVGLVASGERRYMIRQGSTFLLIAGIGILHFFGMAALQLEFDPEVALPPMSLAPTMIAPIVASVSAALVLLALVGLRLSLAARAQTIRDRSKLRQLADLAVEGLAICDGLTIDAVNESLSRLTGYSGTQLSGRSISSILPRFDIEAVPEQEEEDSELRTAMGQCLPVRVLWKSVSVGMRQQTVVAVRDQSERLRNEQKIRSLAFSDTLTGLANRLHFNETLAAQCFEATKNSSAFALLLLDLDRFKAVNDTLGHMVGDELLVRVSKRLTRCRSDISAIARLGGDEFALIVNRVDAISQLAETIIDMLSRPFLIEGSIVEIAGSIGIAIFPDGGMEPAALTRHADLALYAAKHAGGNTFRFFSEEMSSKAETRRRLELDLRRALARDELEVHYQPQVDPATARIQGAEALVRWRHPTRGMISPNDFIPLAEELGLIGALGEWVLREACREAATWPEDVTVAVNLSALQLRDAALPLTVQSALESSGLPASRLELEITESALMQDETLAFETLHRLRGMGIRISMDDFGTGYSSLNYLRRFPFSKIKIDQSFVRHVPHDQECVAIVQAITTLASKLQMSVTVEGVETNEQRAFTVTEGCDQIQGYLISRPVDANAVRTLLTAQLLDAA
ncbi:diguanylate cyclase [Xaviernesmea oryzae]|uniref:Diguanylate cyclase n=2 Tax=Xaviernesmea oryzae TaxID=464029 RepID=A0A1Q9ATV7_9HYPH|nr:diguanylate cyclase [Xaviernesmea oryzae]SEM11133.1 PAS domain S-box-containing protein/diguanylate cyclase (GGDEF) domain-containing protein [Xaviernesmea oryzae]